MYNPHGAHAFFVADLFTSAGFVVFSTNKFLHPSHIIYSILLSINEHVVLPKDMLSKISTSHLMTEEEWRRIGVQQSRGWIHYMIHNPEPHVLLFKRPLPKEEQSQAQN